jgi:hypothetical protein
MATAKWATPSSRSSNLASTTLNSLANGSESTAVTYDNSTNKNYYGIITLKLGSITPATAGSITLRVTLSDGTDVSDRVGGETYSFPLTTTTGAKIVIKKIVLDPFLMRFSFINNSGVTLASSANEVYVTPWNEDVT